MERYSEYKDSGVQWLGEIPSHWDVISLKHLANISSGSTPSSSVEKYWNGNVRWITPADFKTETKYVSCGIRNITEEGVSACSTVVLPQNSVVFSKRAPVGQVSITTEELCVNQGCIACVPNSKVISTFLYYLLSVYRNEFDFFSVGTTFREISLKEFSSFKVSVPSILEQELIVKYLDSATSKIDTAISQQQKMIDLLNERKQIIINNAVTKGLDPNVKMKDSGVDWIGEIPEGWEVRRGKFLFKIINEYSVTGEEELLTVSDRTGITPRSMKNVTMFMAESLVGYKKCQVGDICSNIMWMWHGAVGVTKYDGVISPSYGVYRQIEKNYVDEYLDMMLRLPKLVSYYASKSTGLTESRLRLYPDDFMNIFFFVPPHAEQKQIVNKIKSICEPIDNAINAANKQISLLQERKQIIINEVVTGKVKVS